MTDEPEQPELDDQDEDEESERRPYWLWRAWKHGVVDVPGL